MDPLLIFVFLNIFTPGPNNILSSYSSSRIGFKKTIYFMLGVLVGTFVIFVLTGIIVNSFLDDETTLTRYIGYLGAIYMIYLAFKIATLDIGEDAGHIGTKILFKSGILLAFINPKMIIFGFTIAVLISTDGPSFFEYGIIMGDIRRFI